MTAALPVPSPAPRTAGSPERLPLPGGSAPVPLPATSVPGRRHLTWLVRALTEVLAGRRARHQLAPVLTYAAETALRVLPRQPHTLRVRSVHLCQVDRVTVELAATLVAAGRAKALAARVEHDGRGWRFTAVHLLGR